MCTLLSTAAATDFSLKVADAPSSPYPVVIAETGCTKLWYRKDDHFKVPRGKRRWRGGCICRYTHTHMRTHIRTHTHTHTHKLQMSV